MEREDEKPGAEARQRRSEKRKLNRLVNTGKIRRKDVYHLIIRGLQKNRLREAEQSRYIHDDHYDKDLNGLAHTYMDIEYPDEG